MTDDFFRGAGEPREYFEPHARREFGRDLRGSRDYGYSSARDYVSAGAYEDENRPYRFGRDDYAGYYTGRDYGGWDDQRERRSPRAYGRYGAPRRASRDWDREGEDRGFFDRAGDEVRSWFGDEEAERRRALDRQRDADYFEWRNRQIADLDRDYEEYRRENAQRFASEFGTWRTERQTQRGSLARVTEHMEVIGSDGAHVGTVDKVRGDRIILTKSDPDSGGHHHSIPSRWIESVDDKVHIRKSAGEAHDHWRDEERSGAFFGDDQDADRSGRALNRSSAGTY